MCHRAALFASDRVRVQRVTSKNKKPCFNPAKVTIQVRNLLPRNPIHQTIFAISISWGRSSNWNILLPLLPAGVATSSTGFRCREALARFLFSSGALADIATAPHMGYSLRETGVGARLADWADVPDVALLKRMRTRPSSSPVSVSTSSPATFRPSESASGLILSQSQAAVTTTVRCPPRTSHSR